MLGRDDFAGRWRLERRIDDRLSGQEGRLSGEAMLTPEGDDALAYAEMGQLRLGGGPPMEAVRRYRWVFGPTGVSVSFDDGRPFHRFVPEGHIAGTDHPCGADLYRVRYDFTRWPRWQAVWEVRGPRKDYVSVSHYSPIG
ncbi:MAG: hypothetical protein GC146_05450 [Limimaricola sp.]|nr:DUF6314 family protein [Limimaricola sp.]MBI1416653.1 hypothetical protein [Limimaricola sp.]